jgi:chromosome partitioning protein
MLSVHLAAYAMKQGLRVAAIDTDPQGSMMQWHSRAKVTGHEFPETFLFRPSLLRKEWPSLKKQYDVLVLDTPPSASVVIDEFAPEATAIVVPVAPAGLDLDVLGTTLAAVPRERVHLVLNRCDPGKGAREVREALLALELPLSVVRDYVAFRDATLRGGTVLERSPSGPAADDVRDLARKVLS